MMMSRVCVCGVFFLPFPSPPSLSPSLLPSSSSTGVPFRTRDLHPQSVTVGLFCLFPFSPSLGRRKRERGKRRPEEEENKRKKREMLFFVHLQNMFYTCPFPEREGQAIQRQGKRRRRRGKRGSEREREGSKCSSPVSLSLSLSLCLFCFLIPRPPVIPLKGEGWG